MLKTQCGRGREPANPLSACYNEPNAVARGTLRRQGTHRQQGSESIFRCRWALLRPTLFVRRRFTIGPQRRSKESLGRPSDRQIDWPSARLFGPTGRLQPKQISGHQHNAAPAKRKKGIPLRTKALVPRVMARAHSRTQRITRMSRRSIRGKTISQSCEARVAPLAKHPFQRLPMPGEHGPSVELSISRQRQRGYTPAHIGSARGRTDRHAIPVRVRATQV